jgi:YihY family inner membrane protein
VTWPAVARLDRVQRGRPWLAFPVAVAKKFGDDRAGSLAGLIAYYGFSSLFPLLLVFVTTAEVILRDRPELRARLIDSALAQFPVIGDRLASIGPLEGTAWVIAAGSIVAVWAGLGGIGAAQRAMDDVWDVPRRDRPPFLAAHVRALLMLAVLGSFLVALTLATASVAALGGGVVGVALAWSTAVALNTAVATAAFRVLGSAPVGWTALLPGGVFVAVVWTILQAVGGWLVDRRIRGASELYGTFGIVLGLLAWIYAAAQIFLVGAEINVVRHRRLWPRRLFPPPLDRPDRRAIADEVREQTPRPDVDVRVGFHDEPGRVEAGPGG